MCDVGSGGGGSILRLDVSGDQVERFVGEIRGGSAPGIDNFPSYFLKSYIKILMAPLKCIINLMQWGIPSKLSNS